MDSRKLLPAAASEPVASTRRTIRTGAGGDFGLQQTEQNYVALTRFRLKLRDEITVSSVNLAKWVSSMFLLRGIQRKFYYYYLMISTSAYSVTFPSYIYYI